MLRRPPGGNFGGFWVFPGGRVDAADHCADDDDPRAAFRRAASREMEEECALRTSAASLVTMSYWEPPPRSGVRFGTWFFASAHPGGDVVIDGSEIVDHAWVRPKDGHARRDAGGFDLAPPTWVTLQTISAFASVERALAALGSAAEPFEYRTRIAPTAEAPVAMWTGDAGYATGDAAVLGSRHRLVMGARYRFEHHH
jgi:8-oxo-dGTP pyrophosphatase MutT (NUDIX family)